MNNIIIGGMYLDVEDTVKSVSLKSGAYVIMKFIAR